MYLLILGCNVWNMLLLSVAMWLAFFGAPRTHLMVSLFAAVFSALVHGGGVALFLGAGKLIKEHLGRFNMPAAILDRLNEVYHAFIPRAILGAAVMPLVGVVGGLAGNGWVPRPVHAALGIAGYVYLAWLVPHEYRWLRRFHGIVGEVSRRIPPEDAIATAEPHPGYRPDQPGPLDAMARARALLYVGLTLPVPYLGYRFIVGFEVGTFFLIVTVVATVTCLSASLYYYRRGRRAAS